MSERKEMSIEDLRSLLQYIEKNHSFRKSKGKRVKYVSPTCDMRTGSIFHVNIRLTGEGKDFSLTNEDKDRDLLKWIVDWLDNGSWKGYL